MDLKHFSSYISCISKETELDGSKTTRRKPHQTFSCGFFISGFRFTVARFERVARLCLQNAPRVPGLSLESGCHHF